MFIGRCCSQIHISFFHTPNKVPRDKADKYAKGTSFCLPALSLVIINNDRYS